MNKTVFIPMTRMNALGCLDSMILAPPAFLKKRKYYEDFTDLLPLHIVAFTCPVLPHYEQANQKEDFNFIVLIEAELSSDAGIRKLGFSDTGIVTKPWKKANTDADTVLLLMNPLPLDAIQKIYVKSQEDLEALQNDPLYEDRNYKIGIEVWSNSIQETNFFETIDKYNGELKKIKGFNDSGYENTYKIAGGMALLAEVSETQDWDEVNPYVIPVAEILDAYIQKYINLESCDFRNYEYYRDPVSAKDTRLKELWHYAERSKKKREINSLFEEPAELIEDKADSNIIADQRCLRLLAEECIKGHPKKLAPTAILENVKKTITESPVANDIHEQMERMVKGLDLVLDIMAGRERPETMFSAKTTWARSLRAAALFCLRPEPGDMLVWTREQKPAKAEITDYLRAAFLCGLYHGYSRMHWQVKQKWSAFINVAIRSQLKKKEGKKRPRDIQVTCYYEKDWISGKIKINYNVKDSIEIKTCTPVNSLIQDFSDRVYPMAVENMLGVKEKAVLAIMANQLHMNDRIVEIESKRPVEPGKKQTMNSEEIAIHTDWDYRTILERIADSEKNHHPEETIHLISHYLGYKTHDFYHAEEVDKHDDNVRVLAKIDAYLEKALQHVKDIAASYPALGDIHNRGVKLGHELVNLLRTKDLNEKVKKEVQSALLYLVLEDDVISEEMDPVFGMIDDWIWLAQTAERLGSLKSKTKKTIEIMQTGEEMRKAISDEYSEHFYKTIVRKIDMAFKIRKWIID